MILDFFGFINCPISPPPQPQTVAVSEISTEIPAAAADDDDDEFEFEADYESEVIETRDPESGFARGGGGMLSISFRFEKEP